MNQKNDTSKVDKDTQAKNVAGEEDVFKLDAVPTDAPNVADIGSHTDLNTLATSAIGSSQNQALLQIRHKALEELSDLVDNLDHSPEQHFQTLMMIIQETDNMSMIDKAYAAAVQMKDAKGRAQALLAIANEITYFTSSK